MSLPPALLLTLAPPEFEGHKMSKKKSGITCAGCGIDSADTDEYNKSNPVGDDGTFAGKKFVCTHCYSALIPRGLDVGPPELIQERAAIFWKERPR